jgi:hypothetical protein
MLAAVIVALLGGGAPLATGCARGVAGSTPSVDVPTTPPASASSGQAGDAQAQVYVEVLRRYLGTPADNSFPGQTFTHVYVLDRAVPGAGDPMGDTGVGTPIAPATRERITSALSGVATVSFIADRDSVIVVDNGCAQVRDGGILITLGPLNGDGNRVEVGINGFVACLGATWLTYVVVSDSGAGWRVTGTTGARAIA